jgi:hypothetical protein
MSAADGEKLIEQCQEHILATMRGLPECAPANLRSPISNLQPKGRPRSEVTGHGIQPADRNLLESLPCETHFADRTLRAIIT